MRTTTIRHISRLLLSGALLLSLASCINDNYDEDIVYTDGKVGVELNIQTRSISSVTSTSETYVEGTEWENYIDIAHGDYRVYFFTYNPTTESTKGENSTLIAEFKPTDIFSTDFGTYTTYTMSGEVDADLISSLENFKVVVIANWGTYPEVSVGTTTIDDICNAGKYSAFVQNGVATMPSASNLIPFFGVHEYSGVTWTPNRRTTLTGDITLLRSVAKVEVILDEGSDYDSFDEVSIVNYNAQGYCAPTGVYLKSDYDHDGEWKNDFVDGLHLVNDANDTGSKTMEMQRTAATTTATPDTWTCYLTEYDNTTGTDYSYISVKINDEQYQIYFSNYTNGSTTAYGDDEDTDKSDRYDIYRNYLYRFHVTLKNRELRVFVETWENVFDNEWTFGVTEPEDVDATFTSNNIMYKVLTSTVSDPNAELTVCTTTGSTFTSEVEIPSTVRHNGFTYTVTEIGDNTFDGEEGISSIILPETIEAIGSKAFNGCTYLTALYIYSYTPPTCQDDTFEGLTRGNVTLYVPYEVKDVEDEYNQAPWTYFKSIEGIPGTEPETNP